MKKQIVIVMGLLVVLACYEPRQQQGNTENSEDAPDPWITAFSYEVAKPDSVYIVLLDQRMNLVDTLLKTYDQPGKKHFSLGAQVDTLKSGIYFYRVQIGNSSYTKKFIMMK